MRRNSFRLSSLIAGICVGIYLAAVIFTVVKITTVISERRIKAAREFKEISTLVAAGDKGFMDELSKNRVQEALAQSETLQGLIVNGSGNTYPFEREPGIIIPVHNDSGFQFVGRLGFSKNPLSAQVPNATIAALYSIFDYQLFISIFKQSLIAILAAFCIAFTGLLIQFFSGKSTALEAKDELFSDMDTGDFDDLDLPALDSNTHADKLDFSLPEIDFNDQSDDLDFSLPEIDSETNSDDLDFSLPEIDSETNSDDLDFTLPEADFNDQSDDLDFSLPEADSDTLDFNLPEADSDTQSEGDLGAQSSHQVMAAQSGTASHLRAVLQECTATDKELACLILEAKEVGGSEALYQTIAGEALKFFGVTDGVFQKDARGITLILPGETLEGCRAKVETLHQQILEKHGDIFWEASDICIGLSARQGRDLDAERLLLEASTALKKALADPQNPIIAFKVDPERYKAFLNQKK
ncbi:MAG: MSCRAMM family adhesin SdrC [Spirochaetaceae bacterium]|jgi:hypothetical protein|nr:MSCRAMM family adhesin SdrC [Spirochaetaceae bacterium]